MTRSRRPERCETMAMRRPVWVANSCLSPIPGRAVCSISTRTPYLRQPSKTAQTRRGDELRFFRRTCESAEIAARVGARQRDGRTGSGDAERAEYVTLCGE